MREIQEMKETQQLRKMRTAFLRSGRDVVALGGRWLSALVMALLWLVPVGEAKAQLGVEVQAGTTGVGGGLSWPLASTLAVRLTAEGSPSLSRREHAGDNRYVARLSLGSAAALLDWHPTAGHFRVTAGALYDGNHVDGDSVPSDAGTYTIGNLRLPASLVGTLHGKIDFPRFAPYAGLGWGAAPRGDRGLGAYVDLGVAYQGHPRVALTPEPPAGSPLNNPIALALLAPEIAREEAKIQRKIDGYRYLPVLAAGISYRF